MARSLSKKDPATLAANPPLQKLFTDSHAEQVVWSSDIAWAKSVSKRGATHADSAGWAKKISWEAYLYIREQKAWAKQQKSSRFSGEEPIQRALLLKKAKKSIGSLLITDTRELFWEFLCVSISWKGRASSPTKTQLRWKPTLHCTRNSRTPKANRSCGLVTKREQKACVSKTGTTPADSAGCTAHAYSHFVIS